MARYGVAGGWAVEGENADAAAVGGRDAGDVYDARGGAGVVPDGDLVD